MQLGERITDCDLLMIPFKEKYVRIVQPINFNLKISILRFSKPDIAGTTGGEFVSTVSLIQFSLFD